MIDADMFKPTNPLGTVMLEVVISTSAVVGSFT
jgi:hypothetical protein